MKYITFEVEFPDDAIDVHNDAHQQGMIDAIMTTENVTSVRVVGVGESVDDPGAAPQADDVATKYDDGAIVPAEADKS